MAEMSSLLGEIYNTAKTASAQHTEEDLVKQANYAFFGELCRAEGINVTDLSDTQVDSLYKTAMEIKAEKEEGKDGKKDGKDGKEEGEKEAAAAKVAAANEEYLQKRAAHVKVSEADFMGRLMAHAFVDEMNKIAEFPPNFKKEEGKDGKDGKKEEGKDGKKEGKEETEKEASIRRAVELTAAFEKHKQASAAPASTTSTPNFDELAAWQAIDMLKSAGVDENLAYARVNAAYTLGLPESVKMASASSPEQAAELRALEICERAGFQVDWAQT